MGLAQKVKPLASDDACLLPTLTLEGSEILAGFGVPFPAPAEPISPQFRFWDGLLWLTGSQAC